MGNAGLSKLTMAEAYRRYSGDVFGYLAKRSGDLGLAEDLTSETFLRAWKARESFADHGKPVRAWLVTIARNLLNDHRRSAYCRVTVLVGDPATGVAPDNSEAEVIQREVGRQVWMAIHELGPVQRQCLFLRFFAAKSVAETARILRRNDASVRAIQHRATVRLRDILGTVKNSPSGQHRASESSAK